MKKPRWPFLLVALAPFFLLMIIVPVFLYESQPSRSNVSSPELTGNRSFDNALVELGENPTNIEAYRTVLLYFFEAGRPEEAYPYAGLFLGNCPTLENGKWCVNQFLSAKRQDLAVRTAILGDLFLESGELREMVREVPAALFLEDSPLRQGMEMAFGKPASRITLGELQEVTYLSVGGNTVLCAFGPEGGPENAVSITVDREIRGGDIGLLFFQGLRRLDCTSYPPTDIIISGLEELSIPRTMEYQDLTAFTGMKKLKTLTIGGKEFRSLEGLGEMEALESLTIYKSSITDLSMLSAHTSIESLGLIDNEKLPSLASLSGMAGLRRLSVSGEEITDLSPLAGLTNLVALSVEETQITDTSFLAGLKNLKELTFMDNESVNKLPQLEMLTGLESLTLDSDEMLSPEGVAALKNLLRLKMRVTKKLTLLAPMTALESLTIYSYMGSMDVSPLGALKNLHTLGFTSGDSFYDSYTTELVGLEALTALPLESLDLQGKGFYGPIDSVFRISTLRELNIQGVSSEGTDYAQLAELKNLEKLYMDGYRDMLDIPPGEYDEFWSYEAGPASAFVDFIGLLENLRVLTATGCGIEEAGFLASLKNLEVLDLGENSIRDISPLEELGNLQYIRLSGNPVADYAPVEGLDGVRVIR